MTERVRPVGWPCVLDGTEPRACCGFQWVEGDAGTQTCNLPWPHDWRDHEVAPRTQVFIMVDLAFEGPEATEALERILVDGVWSWRLLNPASDADREMFISRGDDLRRAFEEEGPIEPLDTVLGATDG